MAFLVLALSCLPCADDVASRNSEKAKTEIGQEAQPEDDHEDACSPFCQCSCCAGFSINHTITAISYDINYNNSCYSSFHRSEIIEISLPIWQPPQLV